MSETESEAEPESVFGIPSPEVPSAGLRWASSAARKEAKEWGELDQIKQQNDGRWLKVYGWILVSLTIVFALIFISALLIWSWHHLAPACIGQTRLHWLNPEQIGKIQSILFSGGMGAVISGIVKNQISKGH